MAYVPQRGDVIRLTFMPQVGREQGGEKARSGDVFQ